MEPSGPVERELRRFPLHSPGGVLDDPSAQLANGEWLRGVAAGLVTDLGLPQETVTYAGFPNQAFPPPYPHVYPEIEQWLDGTITADMVREHESELLDLSAALIRLATTKDQPERMVGMVAYSVLRDAAAHSDSCELQLQLLWTLSLGQAVQADALDVEMAAAEAACPGAPEPRWLSAHAKARVAMDYFSPNATLTDQELLQSAVDDLEALAAEHPLGHVGQADLLAHRARYAEGRGLRPFEVRDWRATALQHIETARRLSSDPALALGHARILHDLGRPEDAMQIVETLPTENRRLAAAARLEAELLFALEDYDGVLTLLDSTPVQFNDDHALVRDAYGFLGYGHVSAREISMIDATTMDLGAGDVSDRAFMPTHRSASLAELNCLSHYGNHALVALGRDAEVADWSPAGFAETDSWCAHLPSPVEHPDTHQDWLRYFGQWHRAAEVAHTWIEAEPGNPLPLQRAGEIAFLTEDFSDALELFEAAANAVSPGSPRPSS